MNLHEKYISRCIDIALNGLGRVAPNPMVGAVVVTDGKIIGEGFHQKFGGPHAEVNALANLKDKTQINESILYVNLEPCSHYGKTPPCTRLIINSGIKKVVVGNTDSNELVAGKGIEELRKNGIEVITGILENECRELNRRFFTFHEKKRPYIILKWAQTTDGFIDIERNQKAANHPNWITDEICRMLVHKWRSEEMGIMAGTETVIKDNPQLNVRDWYGVDPVRIIPDRIFRIPKTAKVFDQKIRTLVFTEKSCTSEPNLTFIKTDFKDYNLNPILTILYENSIQSVIVEGGTKLIQSFITQNLWDEARVFIGTKLFYKGVEAPKPDKGYISEQQTGNSRLLYFRNTEL